MDARNRKETGRKATAMGTETSRGLDKRQVSRIVLFRPRYRGFDSGECQVAGAGERGEEVGRYYFAGFGGCQVSKKETRGGEMGFEKFVVLSCRFDQLRVGMNTVACRDKTNTSFGVSWYFDCLVLESFIQADS